MSETINEFPSGYRTPEQRIDILATDMSDLFSELFIRSRWDLLDPNAYSKAHSRDRFKTNPFETAFELLEYIKRKPFDQELINGIYIFQERCRAWAGTDLATAVDTFGENYVEKFLQDLTDLIREIK